MKRKRLDRVNWGFQYFPYYQTRLETEEFSGLVSLINITDGELQYWDLPQSGKTPVCGKGMLWLQMIPDGEHRLITAKYRRKDTEVNPDELPYQISVWYVDVIDHIDYDPDGVAAFWDIYLDVIFSPKDEPMIDDRDELEEALQSGDISREQYERTLLEGDAILRDYCLDVEKTERNCDRILQKVLDMIQEGLPLIKDEKGNMVEHAPSYVQRLAAQSIVKLVPIPWELKLPENSLYGIEESEFTAALETYQEILRSIYYDVLKSPENFGMERIPVEDEIEGPNKGIIGAITPNENKSRKDFFRLPLCLLALSSVGELTGEKNLRVQADEFKSFHCGTSTVRITRAETILLRLPDYGFQMNGLTEKGQIKAGGELIVDYPANRNVFVVMKALSSCKTYEDFLAADYRYLLNKEFKYDLNDMLRICGNEVSRKLIQEITGMAEQRAYTISVEAFPFEGKIKIFNKKPKMELVCLHIQRNFNMVTQLRMVHIGEYSKRIGPLSERVEHQLLHYGDCVPCGGCKTGSIDFTYQGKEYHKCSVICGGFTFRDLGEQDIPSVIHLIEMEWNSL